MLSTPAAERITHGCKVCLWGLICGKETSPMGQSTWQVVQEPIHLETLLPPFSFKISAHSESSAKGRKFPAMRSCRPVSSPLEAFASLLCNTLFPGAQGAKAAKAPFLFFHTAMTGKLSTHKAFPGWFHSSKQSGSSLKATYASILKVMALYRLLS